MITIQQGVSEWGRRGAVVIFTLCLAATTPVEAGPARKIYFSGAGGLNEADPDGTNVRTVVPGASPDFIVTDSPAGHIYWVGGGGATPIAIRRANLDGSGVMELVTGLGSRDTLALDPANGVFYHTAPAGPYKQFVRRDLDGSNPVTIYTTTSLGAARRPRLTMDAANQVIYGLDSPGSLISLNADGTGFTVRYFQFPPPSQGFGGFGAIAPESGTVYFVDYNASGPSQMIVDDLGGGNQRDHVIAGFREVNWVGVDEEGGHLYLQGEDATDPVPQIPSLFRSDLDGSNLELLIPMVGLAFHVDTAELGDTDAPAVTIFSPSGGATNNEQVTLSAAVSDASVLTGAVWLHDGAEQGPVTVFAGDVTVTGIVLHPGENVLTVRATDIAGNTGEASVSVTWTPDRTATVDGPASVREGQRGDFQVVVDSAGEIGGLTLTLLYDPAEFRDPVVTPGAVPVGGTATVNTGTPGEVTLTFAAGGGTLPAGPQEVLGVSLRARSVQASPTTATVGLRVADVSDGSGTPLPVGTFASGTDIEILARLYTGDINTNARLDTGDATLMQRMLAGIDPPRPWDHLLNDLNGSATLDSGDVVRVLRAVTGIDPQPAPQGFVARKLARATAPPAGPTALLESTKAHGAAGEEIRVRVNLADLAANISGASFALDYPAGALHLDAAADHRPGPLVSGSSFVLWNLSPSVSNYATQSGTISLGASASAPWPGSADGGTLAEFDFTIQPGAAAQPAWPLVLRNTQLSSADGFDVTSVPTAATLTFVATPVSYAAWREARFEEPDLDDPQVSGWDADPDGNGIANGAEYKAGGIPVLEAFGVPGPGGEHCLEVRLMQDLLAVEGTMTAEVSTDGVIWEAAPGGIPATEMTELSVDYAAGTRVVAFRSLATLEDAPRLFLRIVFTAP